MKQEPNLTKRSRPRRILLAEDDPEMRRLLAWSLERAGYEVVECADGISLLRRLGRHGLLHEKETYDLVISDIRMPGYTGLGVLASVREFEDCPPVVLISAFADQSAFDQAAALGAVALLPKPFDIDELIARVRRLLPDLRDPATIVDLDLAEPALRFPLEIEFRHGTASPPVEDFIRHLAHKLDRFEGEVNSCRVVVDARDPETTRRHRYSVKVVIATRGAGSVVVEHESSAGHTEENLYVSLQMVFAAAHRQLKKKRARKQSRTARHERVADLDERLTT